ncbi:TetR/AcrR family transcriptional regulator [Caulobacter sp. BE254]|uniref:TetR/AcrR family transcriptional regulator n=1 Tax=Caulobacter sp. BE254 TaxID=2817720 RepID=UPI0028576379|nr:TetR/AcrR family transcriptional regulator [Caulobacter sp. BE254]MDR7114373.1 AcrR family transcriptional regulator [Caulobacter sp. BE254]
MSKFTVPDLKITPREGYARGQEGIEQILRAAHRVLVEEGCAALTLRRIASECGLQVGNLNYYFRSKDELISALLDAIIGAYEDAFAEIGREPGESAERRLETYVGLILADITTKKTTRIFPELWALANVDPTVQTRVDAMYRRARAKLNQLIAELNPALPENERETLALFISASMEGLTIFAGYEKPWQPRMPWLERLACRSFIDLIKTLEPGQLGDLDSGASPWALPVELKPEPKSSRAQAPSPEAKQRAARKK